MKRADLTVGMEVAFWPRNAPRDIERELRSYYPQQARRATVAALSGKGFHRGRSFNGIVVTTVDGEQHVARGQSLSPWPEYEGAKQKAEQRASEIEVRDARLADLAPLLGGEHRQGYVLLNLEAAEALAARLRAS